MTDPVEVPGGLSEDEMVEFFCQAIHSRGLDPNAATPVSINSGTKPQADKFEFSVGEVVAKHDDTPADKVFIQQCEEAGKRIIEVVFSYQKPVTICVLPGVLASVMKVFNIPRETIIA